MTDDTTPVERAAVIVDSSTESPPEGCMLAHPGLMLAVITVLVSRLGGRATITEDELNATARMDLEEGYDAATLTLVTSAHTPSGRH